MAAAGAGAGAEADIDLTLYHVHGEAPRDLENGSCTSLARAEGVTQKDTYKGCFVMNAAGTEARCAIAGCGSQLIRVFKGNFSNVLIHLIRHHSNELTPRDQKRNKVGAFLPRVAGVKRQLVLDGAAAARQTWRATWLWPRALAPSPSAWWPTQACCS